jgi:hypothetical protein
MAELIAAYEAFAEGREPDLRELPIQYADFAQCTGEGSLLRPSSGRASLSRFGPTSIGVSAFDAVLQQLAGLGVDTDFVCHATILDIEGIA